MFSYGTRCYESGEITYTLSLLNETFEYTARPATSTDTNGDSSVIRINTDLPFSAQVKRRYPKLSAEIIGLVAMLDAAPDDITACEVLQSIRSKILETRAKKYAQYPSYKGHRMRLVCRAGICGGYVLCGSVRTEDDHYSVSYTGATLVEAMAEFRKAVDKFITAGGAA